VLHCRNKANLVTETSGLGMLTTSVNQEVKWQTNFAGISGGEPGLPYAYSGLHVIFAISPTFNMPIHHAILERNFRGYQSEQAIINVHILS
jgi:hypothetical protein